MRLNNVSEIKGRAAGDVVTFRAQALRFWEVAGARMALVGDESALTRVELGAAVVDLGRSYEFQNALVKEYPGGWHSASLDADASVVLLAEEIPISQDEAYIERTYKILAGVQRKKGRREGRVEPWRHPANVDQKKTGER